MSKLFIVDASGFLYRSYHAITNMSNSQGESTNALFGFIRSLLKLKKDFSFDHIVAVFDGQNNGMKRRAVYPEYKANRSSMPEDLRYQIEYARTYCELVGIPFFNIPGVEADDVMGSIVLKVKEKFEKIYLCTSDKDMAQLVDDSVLILNVFKDNLVIDSKGVFEIFGVLPSKIIDFLAITGDSSDNVPGIPGLGPKTAALLIQEFGSLESVLDNPEKVQGKKKQELIILHAEKARVSKFLVTIDQSVEVPVDEPSYRIKSIDYSKLQAFFKQMNFNTFLREFSFPKINEETDKKKAVHNIIENEEDFKILISLLYASKEVCIKTVTTFGSPLLTTLIGICFLVESNNSYYLPLQGALEFNAIRAQLQPIFKNDKIGFYGHNIKYDSLVLANHGMPISLISFDTILGSYILNSNLRQHTLETLCQTYFNKIKAPLDSLIGKGKKLISLKDVQPSLIANYYGEEVCDIFSLKEIFEEELKKRKLDTLYNNLELPLLPILARMERRGIYVDKEYLQELQKIVSLKSNTLSDEIFSIAGEKFNLNSPKQICDVLFNKMKILPPKKTATGFSTDAEVLDILKDTHPIAEKLLEYRSLEKLRSTYIESLPLQINPNTNRIHCTFNQFVTATGRLSCQDPNLQNIPTRTEMGRLIRQAFTPEKKGWSYLSADYSQIELRLLAHFSQDPHMIETFNRGEDIHASTAATIFKVPINEVTPEMRYRAKAVNFGVIYGQQAFGLAKELGIEFKEAKAFIDKYFETFPKVKSFLEESKEKARKEGKSVTYTGRERAIPEILSKNPMIRSAAERLAVNTPLQGGAADLIKKAMLEIDRSLHKEGYLGYMILQIHDELIFEIPDFEIPAIEKLVKTKMENVLKLKIPLIVNISVGKNWKEC